MTEQAAQDPNMPQLDEAPVDESTLATQEPEGQAETATAPVEEDKGGFVETDSDKVQARINKITAEKYAEKRRADELERKLNEQQVQAPQVNQQSTEPKLEDFDYDDTAYNRAMIQYEVSKAKEELQQQQQQAKAQTQAQQTANDFHLKVAAFAEKAPDFEQVVANIPTLPEQTLNAVMQHEKGPELAYYLGKHLDVADMVATSDPVAAAMTLGQISAQLAATPKQVVTSAAPDPIEPIDSGGIANRAMEDMSMDEIYNME